MTGTADRIVICEDLVVARSDIEFFDTANGSVSIQIKVRNSSDRPSPPRSMAIYSAPLGVFLPQRHLVTLTVPSLRPGAKTIVQTTAARSRPLPLGRIDLIPPGRLLTALAEDDDAADRSGLKRLTPSIFDLLARPGLNWVGNLYVFVNHRGVERHLAHGLRVRPGIWNSALFLVGNYGNDAYSFRILGDGIAWSARLFAMLSSAMIEEGRWIPGSRARSVNLRFYPPVSSSRGKIDVEVTQRSTGRKAVVEFSLDAAASGPGCFVV
jgi:hypothetical protein